MRKILCTSSLTVSISNQNFIMQFYTKNRTKAHCQFQAEARNMPCDMSYSLEIDLNTA